MKGIKNKSTFLSILILLLLGSITGNIFQYFTLNGIKIERDEAKLNAESMLSYKLELEKQLNTNNIKEHKK